MTYLKIHGWSFDGTNAYYTIDNLNTEEAIDIYITITLNTDYTNIMGTVTNKVDLINSTNVPGFSESNLDDNIGEATFVLGISTGITGFIKENILFMTLIVLIIVAIIIIIIKKNIKK